MILNTGLEARLEEEQAGIFRGTYKVSIVEAAKISLLMFHLRKDYHRQNYMWQLKNPKAVESHNTAVLQQSPRTAAEQQNFRITISDNDISFQGISRELKSAIETDRKRTHSQEDILTKATARVETWGREHQINLNPKKSAIHPIRYDRRSPLSPYASIKAYQ